MFAIFLTVSVIKERVQSPVVDTDNVPVSVVSIDIRFIVTVDRNTAGDRTYSRSESTH